MKTHTPETIFYSLLLCIIVMLVVWVIIKMMMHANKKKVDAPEFCEHDWRTKFGNYRICSICKAEEEFHEPEILSEEIKFYRGVNN